MCNKNNKTIQKVYKLLKRHNGTKKLKKNCNEINFNAVFFSFSFQFFE